MNNLADIERQAKMLMTAHGVGRLGFEWGRGKTRIAACHQRRYKAGYVIPEKIVFSKHFAERLSMEQIHTVMLHEIAHALTPGDGHGPKWRAKAVELGISPDRCMESGVKIDKVWSAHCPACFSKVAEMHRAPLRVYMCGTAACKNLPGTQRILNWQKNGTWVPAQDMPVRFYNEFEEMHKRARNEEVRKALTRTNSRVTVA